MSEQLTATSEPLYADDPWTLLAHAVVLRAVDDWRDAYRHLLRSNCGMGRREVAECERFFRSSWFQMLSNLDGEKLIRDLRKQENEEYMKRRMKRYASDPCAADGEPC